MRTKITILRLSLFLGLMMFFGSYSHACQYQLKMYDSYGDGWNGGKVTVYVNGTAVLVDQTVGSGHGPVLVNFTVSTGDAITTNYTAGSWSGENEYWILDASGTEVAHQGAGSATPGDITTPITAQCPVTLDLGVIGVSVNPDYTGTDSVFVNINNFGVNTITSGQINWKINGVLQTAKSFSSNLLQGSDTFILVGVYNFNTPGNQNIEVWTSSPNGSSDQNHSNDTLISQTIIYGTVTPDYTDGFENGAANHNVKLQNEANSGCSFDAIAANTSNYGIMMQGGGSSWGATPTNVTAAFNYTDHVAKAKWVVDASSNNMVMLEFEKRIWYSYNQNYVWLRVMINDVDYAKDVNGDSVWQGNSNTGDPFDKLKFNLSAYSGTTFTISIEAALKYHYQYYQNGDVVSIDNVSIYEPPANDGGITQIIYTPSCPGTVPINAEIQNNGTDSLLSDSVMWSINGVMQPTKYWTGALATDEKTTFTLGTLTMADGITYDIKAWSTYPNGVPDQNHINDTTIANGLVTALHGTYTINSNIPTTGNNYNSFTDAVNELNARGVCGPVVFNVANGTYNEQIEINEIYGASSTNTITFQSANGDSSMVTLQYSANNFTQNYVVSLNGADWIRFHQMTFKALGNNYATVFILHGGACNNELTNNVLLGNNSTNSTSYYYALVYSPNSLDTNNLFYYNNLQYGSYGFYWFGNNSSSLETGNEFSYNILMDQYYIGIYDYYNSGSQILNNSISTNRGYSSYSGIYESYGKGATRIMRNSIVVDNTGLYSGIYLYRHNYYSPYYDSLLVANNTISINANSGSNYAIYQNYCRNARFYYNSINVYGNFSGSRAFYSYYGSGTIIVKNNIFRNVAGGYAFYKTTSNSVLENDYNNLISNGSNLAYAGGNIVDLAAWQSATSDAAHSDSIEPGFNSNTDLHTLSIPMNDKGVAVSGVTDDKDGNVRSTSTPDVGAYEYTPPLNDLAIIEVLSPVGPTVPLNTKIPIQLKVANYGFNNQTIIPFKWSQDDGTTINYDTVAITINSLDTVIISLNDSMLFNSFGVYYLGAVVDLSNDENRNNDTIMGKLTACSTMSGSYTIGGANADLSDFHDAITALQSCGVSGPVVFHINSGIYHEQFEISSIPGASATNTVTFQSAAGQADSVKIEFFPTSSDNYVVKMNGAKHITFKNLTFSTANAGSYARIFHFTNHADSNTVSYCKLDGKYGSSTYYAAVYSDNVNNSGNVFKNLTINYCYTAFYWRGQNTSNLGVGNQFLNNKIFNYYYYGIYLYYQDAPQVVGNLIQGAGTYGLYMRYCDNDALISKNDIQNTGSYGIYMYYCDGTSSKPFVISNNFISESSSYGISDRYPKYHHYYHNSINVSASYGLYLYNSSSTYGGHTLYNNNIVNSNTSYSIYVYNYSYLDSADYNNYYAPNASNLAYWGSAVSDLTALKSADINNNQNSVSMDPGFYSSSDLHCYSTAFENLGSPFTGITDDIDGDSRSATPDIGADEYTIYANDALIVDISGPSNNICGNNNDTVWVEVGNLGSSTMDTVPIVAQITTPSGMQYLHDTIFGIASQTSANKSIGVINTTTPGDYTIVVYANAASDGDHSNDTNNLNFKTSTFVASIPYREDFNFWSPAEWDLSGGTFSWDFYNNNAARANFWNHSSGNCIMTSPKINLSGTYNPKILFAYSYGSSIYNDSLEIQIKTCGNNWTTIWKKGGDDLESNDGAVNTSPGSYIEETISIPTAYIGQNIVIRFIGISNWGPDLFIDYITVADPPIVALGNDTTVCANTTLQLDAGSGTNYSYYWRTLSNSAPIGTSRYYTVATADTFIVSVTDNNTGLKNNDTINVYHFNVPTVAFSGSDTICNTDSTQVSINFTGATPWDYTLTPIGGTPVNVTGATSPWNQYLSPSSTTSYVITSVTDSNGCVLSDNSDTVVITVNPLPTVTFSALNDVCDQSSSFALSGGAPLGGNYSGTGVDSSGNFSPANAGPGTHTITYHYTDANGCTDSTSTTQTVNPLPVATITAGANPVTYGFTTTLSGGATNGIGTYAYSWAPSSSINGADSIQNVTTTNLTTNTLFTLTVTDQTATTSCQDTAQLMIHISGGPLTVAPFANHDTVCVNDTVILNANSSGGGANHSYTWTSNPAGFTSTDENPVVVPNSGAWYIVSVYDGANTAKDSVFVGTWDLPTVSYSAFDTICYGDSAMITASFTGEKPFTYTYNGMIVSNVNAMTDSYYKSPAYTTTYKITEVTDNNGCKISGDLDSTIITVNNLPTVTYAGSDTLCFGDSALATATFTGALPLSYTYDGVTVTGVNSLTDQKYLSPSSSKQYMITNVTDNNGCSISGNLDSIYITVHNLPTYSVISNDTICYGDTTTAMVTLTGASPWNITIWSNGTTFTDTSSVTNFQREVSPSVTTVYKIVALTDNNGCSMDPALNTDSMEVYVNPLPTPSFTGLSTEYCEDAPNATLIPTPAGGTFSGTAVTGNSFSPSTAGPGNYDVVYTYTDANGCTNTATNSTIVHALPTVQLSGLSVAYCVDAAATTLTGTPAGGTFSGNGVSGSTFTPATATVGTHTVYYTYTDANTCTNVDSSVVVVNPLPVITLSSLTAVCSSASSFPIPGGMPTGGTWSGTGVTNNYFVPTSAGAGTHTLTYTFTDANGCTNSDSTTQLVNPLPVVSITGFDTAYCVNGAADTLTGLPAGGNFSGLGMTGNVFDPTQTQVGTISILYFFTDSNGCFNSLSATTTINPFHTPSFSGLATAYCLNDSMAMLTPDSTGGVFSGAGINGNYFDPMSAGTGSHAVTYTFTNSFGCVASFTDSTVVNGLPAVSLSGLAASYCANDAPDTLAGIPAGGVFNGANGGIFDPSAVNPGSVDVIYAYTDSLGCANFDTMTTLVNALPMITMPVPQTVCEDKSVTLDAGANTLYSYLWNTGDTTNAITVDTSLFGLGNHTYTVAVTDTATGCSTSDSAIVGFEAYPVISIPDTFNTCGYDPVYVVAGTDPNYSYLWSTGATTPSILIDSSMTNGNFMKFSVTVSSPAGCTESKEFWVKFRPAAYVDLGPDTFMCITGTMTLDAGSGYTYLWSTGETTQKINVIGDTVGVGMFHYSVTVTRFGCTATDDINIMVNPCLGIDTYDGDLALDIYPNPTKGQFTLDILGSKTATYNYSIFNMAGEVVYSGKIETNGKSVATYKFDMSTVPKGVYFIRVQNNDIVKVERIVIQ